MRYRIVFLPDPFPIIETEEGLLLFTAPSSYASSRLPGGKLEEISDDFVKAYFKNPSASVSAIHPLPDDWVFRTLFDLAQAEAIATV